MSRTISLTAAALIAIGVLFAGSASAARFIGTTVEGETASPQDFRISGATLTCYYTTVTGTVEFETELALVPSYESCSLDGEFATFVNEDCEYLVREPSGSEPYTSTIGLMSTGGPCKLEATATPFGFSCSIAFEEFPNEDMLAVYTTNENEATRVEFVVNSFWFKSAGAGCGLLGIEHEGYASYEGLIAVAPLKVI